MYYLLMIILGGNGCILSKLSTMYLFIFGSLRLSCKINVLRIDNGSEYYFIELVNFLKERMKFKDMRQLNIPLIRMELN